jgi:hypothetical protein
MVPTRPAGTAATRASSSTGNIKTTPSSDRIAKTITPTLRRRLQQTSICGTTTKFDSANDQMFLSEDVLLALERPGPIYQSGQQFELPTFGPLAYPAQRSFEDPEFSDMSMSHVHGFNGIDDDDYQLYRVHQIHGTKDNDQNN